MNLKGIHHLTAVSADIRGNYNFYTQVMGMRLVKRSVNQDDVRAYHLFYADALGSPGTDLTFFDWAMPPERRGTHSLTRTALRVNGQNALEWWAGRLREHGVAFEDVVVRDGSAVIDFEDPEGQRLSLIDDGGAGDAPVPWERSPVPAANQIRGLGPITMSVPLIQPTEDLLTEALKMRRVREYEDAKHAHSVIVFAMGDANGPHTELHIEIQPDAQPARMGAGGVHHVAFRSDDDDYNGWLNRLTEYRIPNSGPVDRYWFKSIYLREPNGVLFEIATDGPGFGVDEETATLGEKVVLPPFLEQQRAAIVANLKPLD
ncbi:MAG TPA: ring-cleaving dioxygenase [Longimicrobiales bacterium]|nr:ring-cleaving dioxygenase [Longimicrobiales bacterium]